MQTFLGAHWQRSVDGHTDWNSANHILLLLQVVGKNCTKVETIIVDSKRHSIRVPPLYGARHVSYCLLPSQKHVDTPPGIAIARVDTLDGVGSVVSSTEKDIFHICNG